MANDHIADDRKKVRLIDANAYPCQTCEVSYCYKNCEKFNAWFDKTVDAVEVCRCKDCKHFDRLFKGEGVVNKIGTCHLRDDEGIETAQSCDDFCSYGERKDDGNEA